MGFWGNGKKDQAGVRYSPLEGGRPAFVEPDTKAEVDADEAEGESTGSVEPLTAAEVDAQADVFILGLERVRGAPLTDQTVAVLRSHALQRARKWAARRPWFALACVAVAVWRKSDK